MMLLILLVISICLKLLLVLMIIMMVVVGVRFWLSSLRIFFELKLWV